MLIHRAKVCSLGEKWVLVNKRYSMTHVCHGDSWSLVMWRHASGQTNLNSTSNLSYFFLDDINLCDWYMHIWLHTAPPTYLIVDRPLVQHSVQSAMALGQHYCFWSIRVAFCLGFERFHYYVSLERYSLILRTTKYSIIDSLPRWSCERHFERIASMNLHGSRL